MVETSDHDRFGHAHLILLAHGSERSATGATQARQHAETLRSHGIFADVTAAFLRDDPHPRDVVAASQAKDIYVVPFMASDGYSIETLIPDALGLSGELTEKIHNGVRQRFHICRPVGTHEDLLAWQVSQARSFLDTLEAAPAEIDIIVAGHGTDRHQGNFDRARDVVEALEQTNRAKRVTALFLDQAPSIEHWKQSIDAPTVLVLPFFMSLGRHARFDVPEAIGFSAEDTLQLLTDAGVAGPFVCGSHTIYYGPLLGACPTIPIVTLERARQWDEPVDLPTDQA